MPVLFRSTVLLALAAGAAGAQTVVGREDATWSTTDRLASGQQLHLASPNGSITVSAGSGREVVVRVDKRTDRGGSVRDIGFKVVHTDDGLTICAIYDDEDTCDAERGMRQARNTDWSRRRASANFVVQLPAGVRLRTTTGSGTVTVQGATSDVVATTGSGDVRLSGTAGRVQVRTGSGDVAIEGARGAVEASTGSGDVHVAAADGAVVARTGSGDVELALTEAARRSSVEVSTGSGDITMRVPSEFGAEFEGTTGSGSIRSELPLRVQGRAQRQRVTATIGDGGSRVTMRTGSGDIEIRSAK